MAHVAGEQFDGRRLWLDVDYQAKQAGMTMRQVAVEAAVAPSTLTRLKQGKVLDSVTLGRLLIWLGRPPEWMTSPHL